MSSRDQGLNWPATAMWYRCPHVTGLCIDQPLPREIDVLTWPGLELVGHWHVNRLRWGPSRDQGLVWLAPWHEGLVMSGRTPNFHSILVFGWWRGISRLISSVPSYLLKSQHPDRSVLFLRRKNLISENWILNRWCHIVGIIGYHTVEYQGVCPFVGSRNPIPSPPPPVSPPRGPNGGWAKLACWRGDGRTQFEGLDRKPGTLYSILYVDHNKAMQSKLSRGRSHRPNRLMSRSAGQEADLAFGLFGHAWNKPTLTVHILGMLSFRLRKYIFLCGNNT